MTARQINSRAESRAVTRPRVLIVAGYFDWFSGYQETALARALQPFADVEVLTSNRVSSAFSGDHLERLQLPRAYPVGQTEEHGVTVSRIRVREVRSMVWSTEAIRHINRASANLIIQVMPGQLLSAAPTLSRHRAPKVVLYGDNRAMWSHLPIGQRWLKGAAFAMSKGLLYTMVNFRARVLYGYTPNTQRRLRPFCAGRRMELMALCYVPTDFYLDEALRDSVRSELGFSPNDVVIIAAGKVDPRKRLDWLIASVDRLCGQHPTIRLIIVGDDSSDHSQALRDEVKRRGIVGRVRFLPFADATRLNGLFNAADVGVWPKNPAITIQQAMATGLAIVLPKNDLVGHLLQPGTGRYFNLVAGDEVSRLTSALELTLAAIDQPSQARRERARINRWLSADVMAHRLLTSAELMADTHD